MRILIRSLPSVREFRLALTSNDRHAGKIVFFLSERVREKSCKDGTCVHVKDVLTVKNVDRDGGLGFAGHHAAIVPCVPGAGSFHYESTDDHKDLLARRDLCRSVLAGNEIEPWVPIRVSLSCPIHVDTRMKYADIQDVRPFRYEFFNRCLFLILKSIT